MAVLAGMDGQPRGHEAVAVLHLAAALAHLRIEFVAQDREQPRLEIGAGLEARLLVPGLDQRLLDQIVGLVGILRQRHGKGAQARDRAEQIGLEAAAVPCISPSSVRVQLLPAGSATGRSDPAHRRRPVRHNIA